VNTEQAKTPRSKRRDRGMGKGYPPPPTTKRVWGSIVSSPSGVLGAAPAENGFGAFWAQQNATLTNKNVKMINCILIISLTCKKILALNPDKFGTGFGIWDKSVSQMTSYFFGIGPQNSRLSRKNRDGFATDTATNYFTCLT